MADPVADQDQEFDAALRAAAHSRWIEVRQQRKPSDIERHDWIRAFLIGEELRSGDSEVFKVDSIARTLDATEVDEWARENQFFAGLDSLRERLDELATTYRRLAAAGG